MRLSDRQGLIVWVNTLKQVKFLRRFGNIYYMSKRMKYVVIYVDQSEVDRIAQKLENQQFVRKVEKSEKPFIKTEYEGVSKRDDKEKEFDYKIGI
jgi:uncharacterized protein YlbG (UPF0298 family)